jgi:hypothetical protein
MKCIVCEASFEGHKSRKFCSNKCRQRHFYKAFKKANGGKTYKSVPRIVYSTRARLASKPRYKPGSRTKMLGGVYERESSFQVRLSVNSLALQKDYSIARLGRTAAKLAASLQRMAWIIEHGIWKPEDGDPFEFLSFTDTFKGNQEYDDAVIDDEDSPHLQSFAEA